MGKLASQTRIKWEGDLFHLFLFPYQFSEIAPQVVHSVDLLAGSWGTVGSIISWTYMFGGAKCVAKERIEAIDMKKKSITFKVIEGDLLKLYSEFKIICEMESDGDGEDKVYKCALEYEKRSDEAPEPTVFMDFLLNFMKDIERSRRLVPN
ncbi:kirola-like [Salvia miltiorrhiza]|uniref:kirola-like n=1 Tax=Salvia miltiorrhiza TaxID=226208 RepID=UPI0025AD30A0|nr:kirola-like [Salvia miltiorrhiza]